MRQKLEKQEEYATKILGQIQNLFESDCDNHINAEELNEGDNMTHFIHALANIAPAMVYCKLTGAEVNNLEFNHIANHLVFQYSKKDETENT